MAVGGTYQRAVYEFERAYWMSVGDDVVGIKILFAVYLYACGLGSVAKDARDAVAGEHLAAIVL